VVLRHFVEFRYKTAILWDFAYLATRLVPSARHSELLATFAEVWNPNEQMVFCRFWMKDKASFPSLDWELYATIARANGKPELRGGLPIAGGLINELSGVEGIKKEDLLLLRQNSGRMVATADIKHLGLSEKAVRYLTKVAMRDQEKHAAIAEVTWEFYTPPKWNGLLLVELTPD